MQPSSPSPSPATQSLPPAPHRPRTDPGTLLAAIALAVAIVALLLNFVVPGPASNQGSGGSTAGNSLWAVVSSTGSLARGNGVSSSTELVGTTGQYVVTFDEDVSDCAFLATLGETTFSGVAAPGYASVAERAGSSESVYVATYNVTGAPVNESFQLSARCGTSGLWAVVSTTGAVARENGVVGAALLGPGAYEVDFAQDVTGCAILASPGLTGSTSAAPGAAIVTVASRAGASSGVYIATSSVTGVRTNESFHLAVLCKATLWAVVGSGGNLVRSSNVLAANSSGPGSYQVTFNQNLTRCSFVATIGMPGAGEASAGTITDAGAASNTFGVFVRTTTISGNPTGEPFHLGVFC